MSGIGSGVPPHKHIPGTSFTVDGFRHVQPWVSHYFLSHAHSDHYTGITEHWTAGRIYCSPITAALVQQLAGVHPQFIIPLELNTPHTLDGVEVTLVDANHCPGAVLLLFRLPPSDGRRFVHCGDMRYCNSMQNDAHLATFRGCDLLFLDTTYAHPRHSFPQQGEAVQFVAGHIRQLLLEDVEATAAATAAAAAAGGSEACSSEVVAGQQQQQQLGDNTVNDSPTEEEAAPAAGAADAGVAAAAAATAAAEADDEADAAAGAGAAAGGRAWRRLYLISTYVIGKERLLLATAQATGHRLVVSARKLRLLRCQGLSEEQLSSFTTDPRDSPIRVVSWAFLGDNWPYFRPNFVNMEKARQAAGADEVVGFFPTGWTWELKRALAAAAPGAGGGDGAVVPYPSRVKGACSVLLVPYSEHSSFGELREFVGWLRPKQLVPTVGDSCKPGAEGDKARASLLQHFRGLLDETANKAAFLARMAAAGTGRLRTAQQHQASPPPLPAAAAAAGDDAEGVVMLGDDGTPPASPAASKDSSPAAAAAPAAAAVGGTDETEQLVQSLQAIAGPDLSVGDASRLLAASSNDLNRALNAFYDRQESRPSSGGSSRPQQVSQGKGSRSSSKATAKGGGKSSGKSSSKKSAAKDVAAAGSRPITAFFSPGSAATPKQQQSTGSGRAPGPSSQQQSQQQGAPVQQALSPPAAPPNAAAAAAGSGAGAAVRPRVVLPALKPAPRPQPRAVTLPSVAQQPQQPHTPAAAGSDELPSAPVTPTSSSIAGLLPAAKVWPVTPSPAAAGTAAAAAGEEAELQEAATAVTAGISGQQQEAAAAATSASKRSWGALLTGSAKGGSKSPAAKRAKLGVTSSDGAEAAPAAAAVAAAGPAAQQQPAQPPGSRSIGGAAAAAAAATAAVPRAIREAPLLPLSRYQPLAHACWPPGSTPPYLALALTLAAVDGTTKRLQIADGLTNLFRSLMLLGSQEDVIAAAYLACGKIAPEYHTGMELNVGGSIVSAAVREVCGVSQHQLADLYASLGDLGDVAHACKRRQPSLLPLPPLTITGVLAELRGIAAQAGAGAAGRRQAAVSRLLRSARDVELKYLVRTLIQNIRVGAGEKSVLGPLARAALLHRKMLAEAAAAARRSGDPAGQQDGAGPADPDPAVLASFAGSAAARVAKRQLDAAAATAATAYHTCPDLGILVSVLMEHGPEGLTAVKLTPGVPVKPMLAKPSTGVLDAFEQLAATVAAAGAGASSAVVAAGAAAGPAAAGDAAAGAASEVLRQGQAEGAEGEHDTGDQPTDDADAALADSDAAAGVEAADSDGHEPELEQPAAAPDGGAAGPTAPTAASAAAAGAKSAASAAAAASVLGVGRKSAAGGSRRQTSKESRDVAAAMKQGFAILAEYKYDGQRAQIHVTTDRRVTVISRNSEDRTAAFPDVCDAVLAAADPSQLPLVLDAELVGVDRADGNRVRPFQELATRPRGSAAATAAAADKAAAAGSGGGGGTKRQSQRTLKLQQTQPKLEGSGAAVAAGSAGQGPAEEPAPGLAASVDSKKQKQQQQVAPAGPSGSSISVCVFVFDALCVGGRDLMALSLRERRAAAARALPGLTPGVVQLAEGREVAVGGPAAAAAAAGEAVDGNDMPSAAAAPGDGTAATNAVTAFFFAALEAGSEGLMLKLLDGPGSAYQPAKRGCCWLKLKRDYVDGLADSLDLVPIGAWQGQGRKVAWYSPFLLAVYDPLTETYQSLCRVMSGFSDAFYSAATARLSAQALPGKPSYYDTGERCAVWFPPTEVWEVRGADLSISPVHRAAAGQLHPDKGVGLRFPRFLRIRDERRPEEASGPDLVEQLYSKQQRRIMPAPAGC